MKEIKFRAWWNNPYKNKNIPVDSGYRYYDLSNAKHMERWSNDMCDSEDPELFTGLFDKNGKEIYGGDIVKFEYKPATMDIRIGVIEYNEFTTSFMIRIGEGRGSLIHSASISSEVIGNIYENPELLEGKQ